MKIKTKLKWNLCLKNGKKDKEGKYLELKVSELCLI